MADSFVKRHGRPKPPRATTSARHEYELRHRTVSVFHSRTSGIDPWVAAQGARFERFPTHTEAIAWAIDNTG